LLSSGLMALRRKVLNVYKELLYLGQDYPLGFDYFRTRLKKAFSNNREVVDEAKIKELIGRAEFVVKEIQALYKLRKYRAMKQRYYEDNHDIGN